MASDKPAKNQISEFYQQAMKHAPDVGMPLFTTIQLRHTHEPIFRTTLKLPGVQHPLISFEEQVGSSLLMLLSTSPQQWQSHFSASKDSRHWVFTASACHPLDPGAFRGFPTSAAGPCGPDSVDQTSHPCSWSASRGAEHQTIS